MMLLSKTNRKPDQSNWSRTIRSVSFVTTALFVPTILSACHALSSSPRPPSSSSSSSSSSDKHAPSLKESAIQAADLLADAKSVLFVTGAGISAEAGLPTYRGVSGLYNNGAATAYSNKHHGIMSIEECLSASTYRSQPQITWKYLLQIEKACRGVQPSRAHYLVASAEQYVPRVAVMTQNVDGLHQRAGSTNVLCLHGNLHQLQCSQCGHHETVDSYARFDNDNNNNNVLDKSSHNEDASLTSTSLLPPKCPKCGGSIRPAVVLFDEYLGDDTVRTYEKLLGRSMSDLISMWSTSPWSSSSSNVDDEDSALFDVSVCIGTSALFAYVNAAALAGRKTIEINPQHTPLSSLVDVHVSAGATEALECIYDKLGWTTGGEEAEHSHG